MHSKKPLIDTSSKPGIRLYADLFGGGNTLSIIRNYQYGAIFTDEAIEMRFPIIIKLRDAIF